MSTEVAKEPNWAKASAIMAAGTVVSRVLGFAKSMLLVATIGVAGAGAADAFAIANKLPNNVYAIVIGGVLNAILVPQLVRAGLNRDGGQAYINRLLTLSVLIFGGITAIATVASPLLVLLYSGDNGSNSGTVALACAFAYWCMPQIFFYALYTMLGEVLNAREYFGPYMWTPVINNIIGIAGLVFFLVIFGPKPGSASSLAEWSSAEIILLAGSATLGVACQALLLFSFWKKIGLKFRLDFRFRGNGFSTVGKLFGWTFGSLLLLQGAGLISTRVAFQATNLGASVAALDNAWLVVMLPHSIAVVSITTTFFTRISKHAANEDYGAVRESFVKVARIVGLISVISSAVLVVAAYPFAFFFTTGKIEPATQFAQVIIGYGVGLIFYSFVYVVQRTFFSLQDTKTPFKYTAIYASYYTVGVLFCLLLPVQLIAVGITVVTSSGMLLQSIIAMQFLKRKLPGMRLKPIMVSYLYYLIAVSVAVVAGVLLLVWLGGAGPAGFAYSGMLPAVLSCLLLGAVMITVYVLLLKLMGSIGLKSVFQAVRRRE